MVQHKFNLRDEVKIIPGAAYVAAVTVFIGIQVLLNVLFVRDHNPPPVPFRIYIGVFMGALLGMLILLYGYVYRDAKRRAMPALLWLFIAIFVPSGVGLILYFIFRSDLIAHCPQCGTMVQPGFNFCPKCNHPLAPVCPNCKHTIGSGDVYCPYCGTAVAVRI